jgi:hypothetical protein
LKEKGIYTLSLQDRRLQNALKYIISTFFAEGSSKNLHDLLDQFHFNDTRQGSVQKGFLSSNDTNVSNSIEDVFATNLNEFYDLFNRFVSTLLAYVHDTENQQHKQMDTHNPVHLIMHKWKMVMAYMSEIYSVTRMRSNSRTPDLVAFWHNTIENNIKHVSLLNETILDYKKRINEAQSAQIEHDREIDRINEKYDLKLNMIPLFQGELEKTEQQYNDLKTGAYYLPEFNASDIPSKIPNFNYRLRGEEFKSPSERKISQIPYAVQFKGMAQQ